MVYYQNSIEQNRPSQALGHKPCKARVTARARLNKLSKAGHPDLNLEWGETWLFFQIAIAREFKEESGQCALVMASAFTLCRSPNLLSRNRDANGTRYVERKQIQRLPWWTRRALSPWSPARMAAATRPAVGCSSELAEGKGS